VSRRIGLIGARGHVGSELIRLIGAHPGFELAFVSSRERVGQSLSAHEPSAPAGMDYVSFGPQEAAAAAADALVLALPNDKAAEFVAAIDAVAPQRVVLDLSADFRFDDRWYYGLPELTRSHAAGKTRISNPGCYASAMQFAIAPMRDALDCPGQCLGHVRRENRFSRCARGRLGDPDRHHNLPRHQGRIADRPEIDPRNGFETPEARRGDLPRQPRFSGSPRTRQGDEARRREKADQVFHFLSAPDEARQGNRQTHWDKSYGMWGRHAGRGSNIG